MSIYKIRNKRTGEFMGSARHGVGGRIPWVRDGGRTFSHTKFIRQFLQRTTAKFDYENIEIVEYGLVEQRILNPRSYS